MNNNVRVQVPEEGFPISGDVAFEVAGPCVPSANFNTKEVELRDGQEVYKIPVRVAFRRGAVENLKVLGPVDLEPGQAVTLVDGVARPWAMLDERTGQLRSGLGLRATTVEVVGRFQTSIIPDGSEELKGSIDMFAAEDLS